LEIGVLCLFKWELVTNLTIGGVRAGLGLGFAHKAGRTEKPPALIIELSLLASK